MRVIVRAQAQDDIHHIFDWIAKDNPDAALDMIVRVRERINQLETEGLTYIGHQGTVKGTLELLVSPYIVVYKVYKSRYEILILSVIHTAQNRSV